MAKGILRKEDADKVAVAYSPRKFPMSISPTAVDFVAYQAERTEAGQQASFRIDRIVAHQTGVAELERLSIEEKVEREALERLKEVQEQAYQQAYQLGLDEGRERAFVEHQAELLEKLNHLSSAISSIENLKGDLVDFNETHIMKLIFYMARRLVMDEISARPEIVLNVVKSAIEGAQGEESVTVRLSTSDFEFMERTRAKLGKEFDILKRATFEPSSEVSNGGCIVETNYGDVDATVEQRLSKLWEAVSEKLPRVKNTVGGEG